MIRRALLLSLVGSLIANAWLGISSFPLRTPSTAATPTRLAPGSGEAAGALRASAGENASRASGDRGGVLWQAPVTDDDFRRLAERLRAAGFPAHLVYSVLQELCQEKFMSESPMMKLPFWQRRSFARSPESREYAKQLEARLYQLVGSVPAADKLDPFTLAQRYGSLSAEKVGALAAIEHDYAQISNDANRLTPGTGSATVLQFLQEHQQKRDLLRAEQRADLAKILTPAELAEYDARNSSGAQATARMLQDMAVSEEQFVALSNARSAYDAALQSSTASTAQQQHDARAAFYDQMRATLPDERFYTALASFDPMFRELSGMRQRFPSLTPELAYQAVQLRNEMQRGLSDFAPRATTREAVEAEFARWNARFDSLLGSAAAAAFRQTREGRELSGPGRRAPAVTPPRN